MADATEILHWALSHGIVMKLPYPSEFAVTHAPITHYPYNFPVGQFQKV